MTAPAQPMRFRAALVQLCSGRAVMANVDSAVKLIREAAKGGAQYVLTPEMTTIMELERPLLISASRAEDGNEALQHFKDLAGELSIWLHIGSMAILVDGEKLANRSFLISPDGQIAARYDKIHMFDVDLEGGESYRESNNYQPGKQAVLAELPWGPLGMTICYDLRFPLLFRALARAGAKFLAIPAAFTKPTGLVHWHMLLRARAVESQAFVFAAAQGGCHENGRDTFGHSLIISPWGEILAEGGVEPSVIYADIDLKLLDDIRTRMPSLRHDQPFEVVRYGAGAKASP